jgi:Tol biopolymer transport system component
MVAYVARTEGLSNVFVFDRATGTAQTISRNKTGGKANGNSANPALSEDGRIIVFQSDASNLVAAEDFNLLWDVFRFERETGAMIRVSGDADAYWMEASGGPVWTQRRDHRLLSAILRASNQLRLRSIRRRVH